LPKFVFDIIKRTAEGGHGIEIRIADMSDTVKRMERGLNRAIVGVIISASTIAGSLVLSSPEKIIELKLGGHTLSLSTLLGMTGYSIATILGLWLILSIFRSGKM
jgi:ubiquinone biosynthesis protein